MAVNVKELYPAIDYVDDYTPMIDSFGTLILREDEEGYQGDTFCIIAREGKFGFLVFGWGSCSGCDALQACRNYDDLQELADNLESSIKWFDSLFLLKEYLCLDDSRQYDWYGHSSVFKTFLDKALKLCSKDLPAS
jgi:hypothetical protein